MNILDWKKKYKLLDIIADSNSIIPYKKSEFYSNLKQKVVYDDDHENSKFLYLSLKMRNMDDMNDLYNSQDVVLFFQIIESRFKVMYER